MGVRNCRRTNEEEEEDGRRESRRLGRKIYWKYIWLLHMAIKMPCAAVTETLMCTNRKVKWASYQKLNEIENGEMTHIACCRQIQRPIRCSWAWGGGYGKVPAVWTWQIEFISPKLSKSGAQWCPKRGRDRWILGACCPVDLAEVWASGAVRAFVSKNKRKLEERHLQSTSAPQVPVHMDKCTHVYAHTINTCKYFQINKMF